MTNYKQINLTNEEFKKLKKHDKVVLIYETLMDVKIHCDGTGRIFSVDKDGNVDRIFYKDMLKVYYRGIVND